ncbi:hypothetical protein DACRYDRAFT_95275 [Dacryopinax primogenitus]|uniref:Uncharacterized protein n=1 Tax=Dacryopinax primogenitus (strain DJM 731) TaxID=1858805 RepID=M5G5E3_DACPD|nr:uncharacterized protein DACRYDRAFT_95275 [Dacryopinax primogenitus]EJU01042.1 hypothetical protein DACRYDRAFT_95275 [Dacryopinax primogenitus]
MATAAPPPRPQHHHQPIAQRCPSCPPEQTSFDWAVSVLSQPLPPSVREILTAYSKNGREDRELLLTLLAAKTAEDNRIAHQMALHRSLLHLQYDLPLSPPPEHSSLPHPYPLYPDKPHTIERSVAYTAQDHTYPSPSTSSPPGLGSRSPPMPPAPQALGKRPRSPVYAQYAFDSGEKTSPPTRSSPMSLRGLLDPAPLSTPTPSAQGQEDRPSKRPHLSPAVEERASLSPREAAYARVPESSVRLSPGHRVSHERTRSRDGE